MRAPCRASSLEVALWFVEIVPYVIRRENNVLEVDFRREPNPPAPRFPGASGLRGLNEERRDPGWSFGDEGFSWAQAGRKSPPI
jgi:hypothetical protein